MSRVEAPLLKPSRRRFLFMSAGIVASTSLMKISTKALAFTTDDMTYKAVEVMPDLGPMAMTIAGKDYIYSEHEQKWILAPDGTPNWRDFLEKEMRNSLLDAMRETIGVYSGERERTPEQIAWDEERKIRLNKELTRRMIPTKVVG